MKKGLTYKENRTNRLAGLALLLRTQYMLDAHNGQDLDPVKRREDLQAFCAQHGLTTMEKTRWGKRVIFLKHGKEEGLAVLTVCDSGALLIALTEQEKDYYSEFFTLTPELRKHFDF